MSSFSSRKEFISEQLTQPEETFTDIKDILVKSEEEVEGSETQITVHHSGMKLTCFFMYV